MKKKYLFLLVFSIFLASCSVEKENPTILTPSTFVSLDVAKKFATDLVNPNSSKNNGVSSELTINNLKSIKKVVSVPDENGLTVYYIITYSEGGFIILSADKKLDPVLAFSEVGDFSLDTKSIPSGLVYWLATTKETVKNIRKDNSSRTKAWDLEETKKAIGFDSNAKSNSRMSYIDPGDGGCSDYVTVVGPLTSTTWDQGCDYNDYLNLSCNNTNQVCSSGGACGNPFTGCIATAMAQIMKNKQKPSSFSWSNMPLSYGTSTTAALMKDIGCKVNMSYGCSGSSATMEDAKYAFVNYYGYSSATLANYNYNVVQSQLNSGHPVMLSGGTNTGWWIFGSYTNGHAWVCDGYRESFYCETGTTHLFLNMNWGWGGTDNGYYAFNNFNPGSHTFNDSRRMIYNLY